MGSNGWPKRSEVQGSGRAMHAFGDSVLEGSLDLVSRVHPCLKTGPKFHENHVKSI